MQGDIVAQGVELMLYGMGTVVVFLTLLVVVTTLMSAILERYF
ncbi:MAG: OadG family transporter subunit, partial [Halieaceae bacterium]